MPKLTEQERIQYIIGFLEQMDKFENPDYMPDVPVVDSETYQQHVIPNFIRCGAIPKSELVINGLYEGNCRNSDEAVWYGDKFVYLRYKYGSTYIDEINHFEDDDGYDLFVPIKLIRVLKENEKLSC